MRVASVNQDPGVGPGRAKGAAVHLQAMRAAFRALNVDVVTFDERDDRALGKRLREAHAETEVDLVYERYALGKCESASFCREHDVPLVLEVNAPLAEEASRYRDQAPRSADEAADRELFSRAARIFAVSSLVAEYSVARGADRSVVDVVPNGVDTDVFHPGRRGEALVGVELSADRFVLGFHGRLRPWHGFDEVVTIARRLLDRSVDLHLVTVGEGDYQGATEGILPADRVTHVGWQEHADVARWIARFDALVLPYPVDRPCYFSPLKLAEAMACGVVPVVPAVGDLPSVVSDGETGRVVPPGDTEAFVNAVEHLAHDITARRTLGRAASRAVAGHTWRSIAQRALGYAWSQKA